MSMISVELKARLSKAELDDVFSAHELLNKYVAEFERFFILCKCDDYYTTNEEGEEIYISAEETRKALREYVESRGNITDVDKCVELLNQLMEVIEDKGSNAAGSLAALYMEGSTAGQNSAAKIIEPMPEWTNHCDKNGIFDDDSYKVMADEWIASEAGQKAIKPIMEGQGNAPAFKRAVLDHKPWYGKFIADQKKYREDKIAEVISGLKNLNALPIISLPEELKKNYPVWVKLHLKIALEHIASYLETDKATRSDYDTLLKHYEEKAAIVNEKYASELAAMDGFLSSQYVEGNTKMCLNSRMLRGYEEVLKAWKGLRSKAERVEALNRLQTDKQTQKALGDINLFRWFAEETNLHILQSKDCVKALSDYYKAYSKLEGKRKCDRFTIANAVLSKRYLHYEAPSGTNYKKYILVDRDGVLECTIPLLLEKEGIYTEKNVTFKLANSSQFKPCGESFFINREEISFCNSKRIGGYEGPFESFIGKAGGMKLLVDTKSNGNIDKCFASLSIDVNRKCDDDFSAVSKAALSLYRKAYAPGSSKETDALAGKEIRAIAIDLGLKQFGACAVGSKYFKGNAPDDMSFNIERRFMLKLPGETHDDKVVAERNKALLEIKELQSAINFVKFLKRLYALDKCDDLILESSKYYQTEESHRFLTGIYCKGKELQNTLLSDEYDKRIAELNVKMEAFRKKAAVDPENPHRPYEPGKSFWSIEYLEELRKLLMSWNSLGYHIDEENKTMSRGYGVTATRLLEHINNLKEDRIKTAADLLVQTARGYVYDENKGCWNQLFDPCNVIIFEDLSRYNFRTERSKQENSMLMKWSHREIVKTTLQQAAVFGIEVFDSTDSSMTSKYRCGTNAPGIRCDRLAKDAFDSKGVLKEYLQEKYEKTFGEKTSLLKVGDIVPSPIGSLFVTLNKDDTVSMVNADMNAAENLLERFFTRHTHLLKIKTANENGALVVGKQTDGDDDEGSSKDLGKRDSGRYKYHYGTDKLVVAKGSSDGTFIVAPRKSGLSAAQVGDDIVYSLCRDCSGVHFKADEWVGYRNFWETVRNNIEKAICNLI